MALSLYFVRHGETEANARQVYYGRLDVDINARGERHAREAAGYLDAVAFDRVIVSERKRTWQTARAICPDEAIWEIHPGLNEMDFGEWEGLDHREVGKRYPGTYRNWCDDWMHTAPDGGECFMDMYQRVCAAFDALDIKDGENILIVGHHGPFQCLFSKFLDAPPEAIWHLKFLQGSYSKVTLAEGYPVIEGINLRHREE